MIVIDGSLGEGGGQVLRTSLALSIATGQPFRLENVRAGRKKPGLLRQHLTALRAAQRVGAAVIEGDELGSSRVSFRPAAVVAGHHELRVGSAGSTALVVQAVLPPLLTADAPSTIVVEGGTHARSAPPFEFLERTFAPLVERTGARVRPRLERHGFFPAGGGRIVVEVTPTERLEPFELLERGELGLRRARALSAHLDPDIARRELGVVERAMSWRKAWTEHREVDSHGPGNALLAIIEAGELTEVFSSFGARGVRAEAVAETLVKDVKTWLASSAPACPHLADQLMVPLALAGGGAVRTVRRTLHAATNGDVIAAFLDIDQAWTREDDGTWTWRVR